MLGRPLWRKLIIGGAALGILISVAPVGCGQNSDLANSYQWKEASPESQGISTAKMDALLDDLVERQTEALLVVKDDHIVYEWYKRDEHDQGANSSEYEHRRHNLGAMSKALFTGLAITVAVQDGIISLDDPAWKYIPEWVNDPLRSEITIRHLVTQTSGIENVRYPHETEGWKGEFSRDSDARFQLSMTVAPVLATPGSEYVYSSTGFYALHYALAVALEKAGQPNLEEYLEKRVMAPLGIPENEWKVGRGDMFRMDGLELASVGGSSSARAAARVGQLLVHSGAWEGQEIVDPELVDTMLSYAGRPDLERPENTPGPGIGGWTNFDGLFPELPRDAFVAAGANHKFMLIVPSQDLIVVRFGGALIEEGVWTEEGGRYFESLEKHMLNPLIGTMADPSVSVEGD